MGQTNAKHVQYQIVSIVNLWQFAAHVTPQITMYSELEEFVNVMKQMIIFWMGQINAKDVLYLIAMIVNLWQSVAHAIVLIIMSSVVEELVNVMKQMTIF